MEYMVCYIGFCVVGSLGLAAVCAAEQGYRETQLHEQVVERIYEDGRRVLIVNGAEIEDRTPNPDPAPQDITAEEQERGYIVYQRSASDGVFRFSSPQSGERTASLSTAASQDEKRHVQFAIRALRDLGRVDVELGVLSNGDGGMLPTSAVSVRPVRIGIWRDYWDPFFVEAPKLLDYYDAITRVLRGQSQQFWIKFHVPPGTPAGRFTGDVYVRTEHGGEASLRLELEVYPFSLASGRWWGIYYYGLTGEKTAQDFADMKAHGVNSMLICPQGHVVPVLERVGDRVVASFPHTDKLMAELKRQGFNRQVPYYPRMLSCRVLDLFDRVDGVKFKPGDYYGQRCIDYKAEDYPEDLKEVLKDIFRQMVQHAKEADWPEILWFLVDEPGAAALHERELEWAKVEFPLFVEACPGEKLLCTAYSRDVIDAIGVPLDVRVGELWRFTDDDLQRIDADDSQLWGIRWLCQHNAYRFPRHFAGFGIDRMGLDGFTEWTYYGAPVYRPYDQIIDWQGCSYAFEDEHGNLLSTITWEAAQEGIDDARYAATLRALISNGESSVNREHQRLAGDASDWLATRISEIPNRPATMPEAELDALRREIANQIIVLTDAGLSAE